MKSFSLFYQIKCVIYHASLILRVTHTALHTEINKVPSMQRCALSDSVDSVSSVSSCRDTEIVNTNSNHTSAHELMLQSSDGRSNTTLQTTELQFGGLLAPVIHHPLLSRVGARLCPARFCMLIPWCILMELQFTSFEGR